MNILNSAEKVLKRNFKNKISLNLETTIKFLIMGVVTFSLTACGGGSSGVAGQPEIGGSTGSSWKPPVNYVGQNLTQNDSVVSNGKNETSLTVKN